jgi:hypothetical protein
VTGQRTSAVIAEAALTAVFGATAVGSLREDSPLTAVGLTPADLVCLADAAAVAAAARGITCVLDDASLADRRTVSDLVQAVAGASRPAGEPPERA